MDKTNVNTSEEFHVCSIEKSKPTTFQVYKYRWVILGLFFLVSISSAFQWPMYVIIDNVMEHYYGTSLEIVNCTATTFLLCYVICIYPATYLLQKWGLRFAVTLAAAGPFVASVIKLFSVDPNRFWIVLLGQTIIGITQTYVTSLPATLAAVWFGPHQVSTACSIASIGMQIALAAGCLIPTIIVGGPLNNTYIETNLHKMNMGISVYCGVVLVLIVLLFKAEPPTPPSQSRYTVKHTKVALVESIRQLTNNKPFVLFWVAFSSHAGVFYALCFLLNPTVLKYYPNNASDIGTMGLLFLGVGVLGSAFFGIILDKLRRFRETAVLIQVCSLVSLLVFTLTLANGIVYVYVLQTMIGFFMTAAIPVGLEIGAEMTYPFSESVSSGMLLVGSKIFGFIFTTSFSYLFNGNFGIYIHFVMSAIVAFSTVSMIFIPFSLKRQAADLETM